jgi:hypothetical protein
MKQTINKQARRQCLMTTNKMVMRLLCQYFAQNNSFIFQITVKVFQPADSTMNKSKMTVNIDGTHGDSARDVSNIACNTVNITTYLLPIKANDT